MSSQAVPVPAGPSSATPYLILTDAAQALEFYRRAFGATETLRVADSRGRIGHAEIRVGDAAIMLADEVPEMGLRSPQSMGGSPVGIVLRVADVDSFVAAALAAGAKIVRPVEDKFYGDRAGSLEDRFGHVWHVASRRDKAADRPTPVSAS
jgi:PhnB protein